MSGHLSQELLLLREQSRQALEASWSRIEELQKEVDATNRKLAELEQQLSGVRTMRSSMAMGESLSMLVSPEVSSHLRRLSTGSSVVLKQEKPKASNMQPRGSLGAMLQRMSIGGGAKEKSSLPEMEDVRITLMHQEREAKIKELNEQIAKKEEEITALQDDTSKQQETIQRLNIALEELEAPHLCKSLAEQLKEQVTLEEKLKNELETVQKELTDRQMEHHTLEEDWHDCEDRLADAESNSSNFLENLQRKLRRYNEESSEAATSRTHMIQSAQETLESLRQDLMDYMGPDSCQALVRDVKTGFEGLRQKEEELALLLVDRINERRELTPALYNLSKAHRETRNLVKSLLTLTNRIEQLFPLMKHADDSEDHNPHEAVQFVANLQKQVTTVVQDLTQSLQLLVDSKQEEVVEGECIRVECTKLTQTSDRLTYTIQAKTRQMLRTLDDSTPAPPTDDAANQVAPEMIVRFQARVTQKEATLAALQQDIHGIEGRTQEDSERANSKAETLEEEIQFLLHGLDEKDRMIAAVSGVIDERRETEATLLDEIEHLKTKGIIAED